MRYYWTDERYQITYGKRVARAVKMVDGCSRENGVLCTVVRLWLSFLHEESEWKNFESNFARGVDELHQTYWFEQFFNGKLCCKILYLLSLPIVFFWIGLLGPISSTGGPSSSCEMIILRNKGHGGIIRVCMGIFTTALRNNNTPFPNTRPEKRKIPPQNDRTATNPTQNLSTYTVVSFQFTTNSTFPVQPTLSRSLLRKFPV